MAGIYKAYDIRGVYPKELDEEKAYNIGRAFMLLRKPKKVVVGRDCRESSPSLADALIRGLIDEGADVCDIGLTSTPMFYFAGVFYGFDAGLMVTASHNPKQFNGIKLIEKDAIPLSYEDGIKGLESALKLGLPMKGGKKGKLSKKDVLSDYAKHILRHADAGGQKVVVDSAGGMAGLTFPPIYAKMDLKVTHILKDLDGSFKGHEPDPLKAENCVMIQKTVKKEKADLGICFDADADRVIFIDEKGDIVPSDLALILLGEAVIRKDKRAKLIYDCRSTKLVKEIFGQNAIIHRVGHAYIKKSMREQDVALAGELSGHFYFKDSYFFDDGVLAAVKMIGILARSGKVMSELIKPLRRYKKSPEVNFQVPDRDAAMKKLEGFYKGEKIERIDGISVIGKGWWFNARPSNTESLLRVVVEADTQSMLDEKLREIRSVMTGA